MEEEKKTRKKRFARFNGEKLEYIKYLLKTATPASDFEKSVHDAIEYEIDGIK